MKLPYHLYKIKIITEGFFYHLPKNYFKYGGYERFGLKWIFRRDAYRYINKKIKNRRNTLAQRANLRAHVEDPAFKNTINVIAYKYRRNNIINKVKHKLVRRFGSYCRICRKPFHKKDLTIDHIIQISKGGTNHWKNLQLLCLPCHRTKDDIRTKG